MISKSDLLKDIKIVNLTSRLPGPLAAHLLSSYGAKVIKFEDINFKDPFCADISISEPQFNLWYKNLHENQKIKRIDFGLKSDQEILKGEIKNADILILGIPSSLQLKLGITQDFLNVQCKSLFTINLKGTRDGKGQHDLNALASTGVLQTYIDQLNLKGDEIYIRPLPLPFAGILFAQEIVSTICGGLYYIEKCKTSQHAEISLEDCTDKVLSPLMKGSTQNNYLHNGRFPCYCIYALKDDYLAVACVESKYWLDFISLFNLEQLKDSRFSESETVFKSIAKALKQFTSKDIYDMIRRSKINCLSVIEMNNKINN
ncbi:MAG: alpha-methylacyl-CoA racemase [Thermoproteota archaeon]